MLMVFYVSRGRGFYTAYDQWHPKMTDNGDARKPKDHPVKTTQKSLLLIGDFVIDDSWVAGEYHSATATHVGRTHYRSLHHPGSAVKQHCGVGLVAGILHHAQLEENASNGQPPERCAFAKRVHVLGMWGTSDTEGYLKEMFIPERLMGSNGYRVVPPVTKDKPRSARVFLQNLGDALTHRTANLGYSQFLPLEASTTDLSPFVSDARLESYRANDKYFGTARIVRLFKRTEHRLEQMGRLDWDLSPQSTDGAFPSWLPSNLTGDEKDMVAATLAKELSEADGFDAVVIKDNGKGVVSSPRNRSRAGKQ